MFEDDKVGILIKMTRLLVRSLLIPNFFIKYFRLTHVKNATTTKKLTLVTENVEVVTSTVSNVHLILDQVAMLSPTGIKLGMFSNPAFSLVDTTWFSMG